MKLISFCDKAIEYLFYALFFLVPLTFLPVNFELFEFNKMMLTYAFTVLIVGFWLVKMVAQGKVQIQKTPLDIPILLFLASQIISTITSIDVHTSLWGYYSRFNGGLISIISYVLLYYAFVSNFTKRGVADEGDPHRVPAAQARTSDGGRVRQDPERVMRLFSIACISGLLIAVYGILEHFGIDKDYWVQDVQNRVFSTLGQPNWLAAYLSILIPVAIALGVSNSKDQISKIQIKYQKFFISNMYIYYFIFTILYYITLLFSKSRSGFVGLWTGLLFFLLFLFLSFRAPLSGVEEFHSPKVIEKDPSTSVGMTRKYIITLIIFALITFFVGSPFEQFNKFSFDGVRNHFVQPTTNDQRPTTKTQGTALETGGTESWEIRKIVWRGALDIAKAYPLFGSGVETFAYAYYRFRPIEHNMVSEWDFLYNKAHNEYLNYLANTGFLGLGTYLLMIGWFLFSIFQYLRFHIYDLKRSKSSIIDHRSYIIVLALIASYLSVLVSNIVGFSVVIVNLFFFLIPGFVFVAGNFLNPGSTAVFVFDKTQRTALSNTQWVGLGLIVLITTTMLLTIYSFWDADRDFAKAKTYDRGGDYTKAEPLLLSAMRKRPDEPQFMEEASVNASSLALASLEQQEATLAAIFVDQAVRTSDATVATSPNNTNYWRTRIRVFYALSQIDPKYYVQTLDAARKAVSLAPTDPKIAYNYGLILGQKGSLSEGITELERAVALKPDYRDPIYALGLFYHEAATDEKGKVIHQDLQDKAIAQMELLLKMASDDAEAKKKLEEWKK